VSLERARARLKRLQIQAIGTRGKITPNSLRKVDREILKAIRDIVRAAHLNTECSNCCGKPDACTRRAPQEATGHTMSSPPSQSVPTLSVAKPSKEPRLRLNVSKKPRNTQMRDGLSSLSVKRVGS
jgi:hypothetical protein